MMKGFILFELYLKIALILSIVFFPMAVLKLWREFPQIALVVGIWGGITIFIIYWLGPKLIKELKKGDDENG
ncbi:hypothetical protein B9J77_03585 [candidate division NPL-UPA2 bacterium Unc8]|uniref:Uncharacterized protein n=1 Tax=candidate division NPL-UPA2 bacterium Unc8 TaxID=1980939 RepID=A0A399FV27_UNCN2|nr:hypothetical protein [Bacillota bacterium]RII00218.1 MAG: hypothetical protein B9J77_03585 [candidate division NPL-UPA2 bacterium Unc8]